MPELPEVETIVRLLAPRVEGRRIEHAELRLPRILLSPGPENFRAAHRNAGSNDVHYLGHPQFEGFSVVEGA